MVNLHLGINFIVITVEPHDSDYQRPPNSGRINRVVKDKND